MIRDCQPDLVLLDLSLAPGSGINVLRQARAEGLHCKIIVLTHQPLDAYRRQCEALGADGFHDKGADLELVLDRVREWSKQKHRGAAVIDPTVTSRWPANRDFQSR